VDGSGSEFFCTAEMSSPDSLRARVLERKALPPEPSVQVGLFCALLKGEKMEWVLQKATEVGVSRIAFFESAHCVVRAIASSSHRQERWERIIAMAAAQAGRAALPRLLGVLSFQSMLDAAGGHGIAVLLRDGAEFPRLSRASDMVSIASVALVVGPEGGFSSDEVHLARTRGLVSATLGQRILRAETAAIIAGYLVACDTL